MRILDRLGAPGDPLLRFGVAAMAFSVLCASLVAAYALLRDGPGSAKADPAAVKAASAEPLVRSDPGVEPWKEETVPQPREEKPPPPEPEKETAEEPQRAEEPAEGLEPSQQPEPSLPVADEDWPMPTAEQVAATREPRRYDLPRGAALGLTVPSIDLYDAPVLRANSQKALDNGVVHLRGSSMPGSDTPDRNVYLAAHRLGWPGTGSHLIFYRLNELGEGDEISLKSREGKRYDYRITDAFVVNPEDVWVTGRIPGRNMLTLQTCTPIPGFEKRLIVRAERV